MINHFLTFKKIVLLSLVLFTVTSCGKKEEEEEVVDNASFFNIVYVTKASREIGATSWTTVQGFQRVKFNSAVDDSGATTGSGDFTYSFAAYKEPQLFNSGTCSGGFSGAFTMQATGETSNGDELQPYNPLDPYDDGSQDLPQDSETTDEEETDIVYNYLFSLTVSDKSFTSGCTAVQPQDSFQLRLIRYPNGDLILTNPSRTLEFYLTPELVQ